MRLFAVVLRQLPGLAFPLIALLPLPFNGFCFLFSKRQPGIYQEFYSRGGSIRENQFFAFMHPGAVWYALRDEDTRM
jgi:hypothetical protein